MATPQRESDRLPAWFPSPALPASRSLRPFFAGVARLPGFRTRTGAGMGEASPVLGRIGSLEVRLAATPREVRRAQRLRFKVFCREGAAAPTGTALLSRRETDAYDAVCDHLVVVDHAAAPRPFRPARPEVVGTYRLLRQEAAARAGGFYSAREYDIAPLLKAHPRLSFLELGRSCVLPSHRDRRTAELLWQGIWAYARHHGIDVMMGCASLEGTDPGRHALALSFLHHTARAPEGWRVRALAHRHVAMDMLPPDRIDPKAALHALPPLLKGYLRLGATVGDGAVVDHRFGTTDVFVVLPVAAIKPRYLAYFDPSANRRAA